MTLEDFETKARDFFILLSQELEEQSVHIPLHWSMDHLCYRVATEDRYEELKNSFLSFSHLLGESPVNGRRISSYKLHSPLYYENYRIDVVELPEPKKNNSYSEGFEHVEVVCDRPFDEIPALFPQCRFNSTGLKKSFNQELAMDLKSLCVKFHHISLESVVCLEENQKVFSALLTANILEKLKTYKPLVAGTFPLNLQTPESDVDILVESQDFDQLEEDIQRHFGFDPNLKIQKKQNDQGHYLVARFACESVPFEIFGHSIASVRQRGYRHFQIEERLLKLGGSNFLKKVKNIRNQGLKTEPAFAQALGLKGDPYLELLRLQDWPEEKLVQTFLL